MMIIKRIMGVVLVLAQAQQLAMPVMQNLVK